MITSHQLDRINSIDHERKLIAHALHGSAVIDSAAHLVTQADFLDTQLGQLWSLLTMLHDRGQLTPRLDRTLALLRVLGCPVDILANGTITTLYASVTAPCHASYHAGEIRRLARLRQLVALTDAIQRDASTASGDPDELIGRLRAEAEALDVRLDVTARTAHEIALETVEAIRAERVDGRKPGAMTGLLPLDEMTGGVRPGELCVIGGRPSSGKTSLAMQIAQYNAEKGRPTLVVSLEMRDREILERMLTRLGGVDPLRMRQGQVDERDLQRLASAAGLLEGIPLTIWQTYAANMRQVRAACKIEHSKRPLALAVIDYLQLIGASGGSREQRTAEVAGHSKALKALAGELEIPVVVCAQLNRAAEGNAPTLASLALSGEIEQDADCVWLLHSERREDRWRAVAVAKARNGGTGSLQLGFDPPTTRFSNEPPSDAQQQTARPAKRNWKPYSNRGTQGGNEAQRVKSFDEWNARNESQGTEDF